MSIPTFSLEIGDVITDYSAVTMRVERFDQGGFGLVAFGHNQDGTMLAVKTMRPDVLARNPAIRTLFTREALTWLGVWPHANVVSAQGAFEWSGLPFLVLEYAEHGSLRSLLGKANGPLSLETALIIAQHIAAGLAYLHTPDPEHERDVIIHRDLKPENLLIRQAGQGQLIQSTDFGLAKTHAALAARELLDADEEPGTEETAVDPTKSQRLTYHTRRGAALGTPAYMAPEQWVDAATAGPEADVYALGIILGELFLGDHPLLTFQQRHTAEEWYAAHLHGPRRPLPSVLPIPCQ